MSPAAKGAGDSDILADLAILRRCRALPRLLLAPERQSGLGLIAVAFALLGRTCGVLNMGATESLHSPSI